MNDPQKIQQGAPGQIAAIKTKQTIAEKLQARRFDPNTPQPPEQTVLQIDGKIIGALENIVGIVGLPKQGKSKYSAAIAAAALSGNTVFGFDCKTPPQRDVIAYWATDESKFDFWRTTELIRTLADREKIPDNFHAYHVRRDEPRDIVLMINEYLKQTPECSILLIDNIGDLLINFNDESQSKRIITFLKQWGDIHKVLIICLLHLGKGNMTSLGHLGAGLDRYAQSILKVEKDQEAGNYVLSGERLRSAGEFEPKAIYYDTHQNRWNQTYYLGHDETKKQPRPVKPEPDEIDPQEHKINVGHIFAQQDPMQYGQLIEGIKTYYLSGRNWATKCAKHLLVSKIIFNPSPGIYTTKPQTKLFT